MSYSVIITMLSIAGFHNRNRSHPYRTLQDHLSIDCITKANFTIDHIPTEPPQYIYICIHSSVCHLSTIRYSSIIKKAVDGIS